MSADDVRRRITQPRPGAVCLVAGRHSAVCGKPAVCEWCVDGWLRVGLCQRHYELDRRPGEPPAAELSAIKSPA